MWTVWRHSASGQVIGYCGDHDAVRDAAARLTAARIRHRTTGVTITTGRTDLPRLLTSWGHAVDDATDLDAPPWLIAVAGL